MANDGRTVKFFVDRTASRSDGLFVVGRCLQGPIFVGDQFESVYALTSDSTRTENLRKVSLFVVGIDMGPEFNRQQIDPGHTGRLAIVGNGVEKVRNGTDVLSGAVVR
jgi:hypothetical protein